MLKIVGLCVCFCFWGVCMCVWWGVVFFFLFLSFGLRPFVTLFAFSSVCVFLCVCELKKKKNLILFVCSVCVMICMIRETLCVLVGCSAFMLHSEPEEKQSAKVLKTEQERSEQEQV